MTDIEIAMQLCKGQAITRARRDEENTLIVYLRNGNKRRFTFEQQVEAFAPKPARQAVSHGKSDTSAD